LTAGALLVTAFLLPASAAAATVAIGTPFMASSSEGHATQRFASGTRAVFFRYTVLTPSQGDNAEISVYPAGHPRSVLARATLFVAGSVTAGAQLAPKGGFPDGAYCTALTIDGVPETLGSRLPLGWAVGNGPIPSCRPQRHLSLQVAGKLRAGTPGKLRVLVRDSAKQPVRGATVTLDARGAGVGSIRTGHTDVHGITTFRSIRATHSGAATVSVRKRGYATARVVLRVSA
jgi:hypothetical protein